MIRAVAFARFLLYAAVAACAAFSPDVPRTIALLAPTQPAAAMPQLAEPAAATLGWLATVLATVLSRAFGFGGLAFVTALALVGTLALVEWRARRTSSPAIAFAATLLCAGCLLDVVHVGDGASNAFFVAVLLATFELRGRMAPLAVGIVTLLWCNVSATGILAPGFAMVFAFGAVLDRADKAERERAVISAFVAIAATLGTPAFTHFPVAAWRALSLDNALGDLLPVLPSVVAPLAYHAGVVGLIIVALIIGGRASRTGDTFLFAFAAWLAFASGAFVPFAGIAGAPVLAEAATRLFRAARERPHGASAFARNAIATVAIVAFGAAVVGAARVGRVSADTVAPFGVLAKYTAVPVAQRKRMVCTRLLWCDVADRSYGIAVLADSRASNAPVATIAAQKTIASGKDGWRAKSRMFGVDAIFTTTRSGFATLLIADRWRPYAVDGTGTLFVRDRASR